MAAGGEEVISLSVGILFAETQAQLGIPMNLTTINLLSYKLIHVWSSVVKLRS